MKHLFASALLLALSLTLQAQTSYDQADTITVAPAELSSDNYVIPFDPETMLRFDSLGVDYPLRDVYNDFEAENYAKILADAERVLEVNPADPYGRFYRAVAATDTENIVDIIADMTYAWSHDIDPGSFPSPYDYLFFYAERYPVETFGAVSAIEDQLTRGDYIPQMLYDADMLLGHICGQIGTLGIAARFYYPKAAAVAYEDNLEPPAYLNALKSQARAWNRSGHPDSALAVLEQPYFNLIPEINRFQDRVLVLRNRGRLDDAIAYIDQMLARFPDDGMIINLKGTYLTLKKDYDGATACFDRIIRQYENDSIADLSNESYSLFSEARLRRGVARQLKGDKDGAKADFMKTLEIEPINITALGWLGRRDELTKMAENPDDFDEMDLTVIYTLLGDDDNAYYHLGRAFARQLLPPQNIQYDPNLWRLLDDPRRFEEAASHFDYSK